MPPKNCHLKSYESIAGFPHQDFQGYKSVFCVKLDEVSKKESSQFKRWIIIKKTIFFSGAGVLCGAVL